MNGNDGKIPIIVICGPTASGKTGLAVETARLYGAEVINADSMQIYSGMDIATAMPTQAERGGVPHHLFGFLPPEREFSVAQWLCLARAKIADLHKEGKIPIVVGGTGLYISSLIDNILFDEIAADTAFREQLREYARLHGNESLYERLRQADPEAASRLHMNNTKRVIRALEVLEHSKEQAGPRLLKSRAACSPYEACVFGIVFENRQLLYERIEKRVDLMLSAGLLEEAKARYTASAEASGDSARGGAQAIGHKELWAFFEQKASLESCIEQLKQKTRNYAKRQMTWFRKIERLNPLYVNENSRTVHVLESVSAVLKTAKFRKKK